jgi:hypothetical protein
LGLSFYWLVGRVVVAVLLLFSSAAHGIIPKHVRSRLAQLF